VTTKSGPSNSLPAATLLAALALAACGLLKPDPDVQAVVTKRLLGMSAGEFVDRFGRVSGRTEMPDGSTEFNWQSETGLIRAGPSVQDEPVCRLHIAVDGRGRIQSVVILFDSPGKASTSRCREIFEAT